MSFNIGDIVEASRTIIRKDKRSILYRGEKAKIKRVYMCKDGSTFIVDIDIENRPPIKDIVCFNEKEPFLKIKEV